MPTFFALSKGKIASQNLGSLFITNSHRQIIEVYLNLLNHWKSDF